MAKHQKQEHQQSALQQPMTDQEIREVFQELNLPSNPAPPQILQRPQAPVIVFRISGDSPPPGR